MHEVLDIAPSEFEVVPAMTTEVMTIPGQDTEDEDFAAARSNCYELVDMTKAALNTAILVANESQNPRALEVLGQLLKTSSEINRQLIQMNKDKIDVKAAKQALKMPTPGVQPQIGQQNVFIGTSNDMQQLLKSKLAEKRQ